MYKKLKILVPLLLLIIFSLTQFFRVFPAIDNVIYDNILVSRGEPMPEIIIVGIDERSMNEIGVWPWPRFFMAEAIEILTDLGAAAIGINVVYSHHGTVAEHDVALVAAAARTDRLVLGSAAEISETVRGSLLEAYDMEVPFNELNRVSNSGFLNMIPDADGVLRRALTAIRFGDITEYSFAFEVYRTYAQAMGLEVNMDIPLDNAGQFPIQFAGGPGSFTTLSFWGVINEHYNPAMFRDAIVLIGPYARGIGDGDYPTPLERRSTTFGIELYANIIQNLIQEDFKTYAPWWLNLVFISFAGLVAAIFLHRFKQILALVITVGLFAGLLIGARVAFVQFDTIVLVGSGLLFLIACYIANLVIGVLSTQSEKQHVQGLFGRFVSEEVVKEILSGGIELQLGGTVKEISVLFVDIRGFTAFSENNPPEKVVDMVNLYLGLTSSSIQKNNGTIDKYMGDATMALFNAPNDVPDHALCAVKAAWAMKQGAIELQGKIMEEFGVDLQFGIGVNTGKAVIGNMGSDFRMEYTAIGDAVNTAARLESNSEKGQIVISDATYQQVKDHVEVKDLGIINVKNKKVGIQIYSLEGVH